MRLMDWRLSDKEIAYYGLTTETTSRKYRKIYAPETIPKRASRVAIKNGQSSAGSASWERQDKDGTGGAAKV